MNRLKITFFLCFVFLISLSGTTHSACLGGDNGVWTTSGNEAADINDCISVAKKGDTIRVMEGTGEVYWPASAVTIPADKPLNIIGPGKESLTITLGGHYVFSVNSYVGTTELPATRISGFKFLSPLNAKYAAFLMKGQGWRIDHCEFESLEEGYSTGTAVFVLATGLSVNEQPYGLIDNNIIINGKIGVSGASSWLKESTIWAAPIELGTANAVYVEDNSFSTTVEINPAQKLSVDANYGGKYVFRYNSLSQYFVLAHGVQSDTNRGTKKWEIYGNTFNSLTGNTWSAITVLAGSGVILNNDFTSVYPYDININIGQNRNVESDEIPLAGICDGDSPWDSNYDATGWICRDQVGAGQDKFVWQSPPTENTAPNQPSLPAYIFNNTDSGDIIYPLVEGDAKLHVYVNRDYYTNDTTNCAAGGASCTAGVGCGTLATRPTTCTTGVAYWATNQSCSDLTGMVGANPTTPISGTLYKCTAPNTWTAYYTPYTYPHPLRGTNKGNKGATIINTIGGLNAIDIVGGLNVINQ